MNGWQPIETAPRDGTAVLTVVAGKHPITGQAFIPDVAEWTDTGWFSGHLSAEERVEWTYDPTHWMPLPAAPDAA